MKRRKKTRKKEFKTKKLFEKITIFKNGGKNEKKN